MFFARVGRQECLDLHGRGCYREGSYRGGQVCSLPELEGRVLHV